MAGNLKKLLVVFLAYSLGACATGPSSGSKRPGYPRGPRAGVSGPMVPVDPDNVVGHVWNRWVESKENKIFVNGGDVIDNGSLPEVLSQSSNQAVVDRMKSYETWASVGQVSAIIFAMSAISTGVGYVRPDSGATLLDIGVINILWGVSAIALGSTVFSFFKQDAILSDAMSQHNQLIRQRQGIKSSRGQTYSFNMRFEF